MKQTKLNTFAVVILFAGMITYIFVDMGVFNWDRVVAKYRSAPKEQTTLTSQQALLEYASHLKVQLENINQDLSSEKKTLSNIQQETVDLSAKINVQRKNLNWLEQEIKGMKDFKKKLLAIQAKAKKTNLADNRRLPMKHVSVSSEEIQFLQKDIESFTNEKMVIVQEKADSGNYLRFITDLHFDRDTPHYLTSVGLRQVKKIISGGIALNFDSISVMYKADDSLIKKRVDVLKSYIKEMLGDEVSVSTHQNDSFRDQQDVEIWMTKRNLVNESHNAI